MNDPPVAQDVLVETVEGTPVMGQFAVSDAEGDWLFYSIDEAPKFGSVYVDLESGTFTYTPDPNSAGVDRFRYTAYDWQMQSNTATVEIVIAGGDTQPR